MPFRCKKRNRKRKQPHRTPACPPTQQLGDWAAHIKYDHYDSFIGKTNSSAHLICISASSKTSLYPLNYLPVIQQLEQNFTHIIAYYFITPNKIHLHLHFRHADQSARHIIHLTSKLSDHRHKRFRKSKKIYCVFFRSSTLR